MSVLKLLLITWVVNLSWKLFLFREIPYDMKSIVIKLTSHIEQKWLRVIRESLMVQKELGEVTQILTVDLLSLPIHFKHADPWVSVYLIPRRVPCLAPAWVPTQLISMRVKVEAILAEEESVYVVIPWRKRRVIPSVASVLAELNEVDGSYFGRVLVFLNVFLIHAVLVIFQKVFLLFSLLLLFLISFEVLKEF